ncbi:MAG: hypothetical protein R2857_00380 [Vampirovibrionales bacterium]
MDMERANLFIKPNEFLMLMGASHDGLPAGAVTRQRPAAGHTCRYTGDFPAQAVHQVLYLAPTGGAEKELAQVLDTFASCFKSGCEASAELCNRWPNSTMTLGYRTGQGVSRNELWVQCRGIPGGPLMERIPSPTWQCSSRPCSSSAKQGVTSASFSETLSKTVRERFKLMTRCLSAQGKLSAYHLYDSFGLASIYSAMFPEVMMNFFHHPIGWGLNDPGRGLPAGWWLRAEKHCNS